MTWQVIVIPAVLLLVVASFIYMWRREWYLSWKSEE